MFLNITKNLELRYEKTMTTREYIKHCFKYHKGWIASMTIYTKQQYNKHECFVLGKQRPNKFNIVNEDGQLLSSHRSKELAMEALIKRVNNFEKECERYQD